MDESRHLPGQPRRNLALFAAALGALTLTGLAVILCHSNLPVALSAGFTPKRSTAFRKPAVSYARQPLRFEENAGQTDGQVEFLSRGYSSIDDPIFPEDPRYDKHIIQRP